MLKNYFLIKKTVSELDKKLRKKLIKQVFTEIKNELLIQLDSGFIQIGLHRNIPFLLFKNEHNRKSQSMTILQQLEGETIETIRLINNKRVIEIKTGQFNFILNLYYSNAGVGLFDQNGVLVQKVKSDPREVYFSEDLHENHFHQLLKDEMQERQIDKSELQEILNQSENLYLYRLSDKDVLSLIELKQFDIEPLTTNETDFLATLRRILFMMMNRLRRDTLYNELDKSIFHQTKKVKSTITTLNQLELDQEKKQRYEQLGHLIMANLNKMRTGEAKLITNNLFSEIAEQIEIPLKTNLSPQENAQIYYQKAKQFDSNKQTIQVRLKEAEKKMSRLIQFQDKLDTADQIKDLDKLRNELIRAGFISGETNKDKRLIQNPINSAIHFLIDSYDVYIGKSAENNDFLSVKFAKANDYWFHVHGSPGSHVVLRWHGEKTDAPKDLLKKIAALTAFYSKQKNAGTVPVVYTRAKYVRKPKGAKPGTVTITKEKSILVQPKSYEELV